jgi:hypothetical protein
MNYSEMFYLVDAGQGRWVINHTITDEAAGTVLRTTQGLALRDEKSRFLGTFPTMEMALRNLYAVV